jgi:hypothetical protein
MPAGTTKVDELNQLFVEHGPVAPLTVWVYTFEAAATEGEYASGATATTLASAPMASVAPTIAVKTRRLHLSVPSRVTRIVCPR